MRARSDALARRQPWLVRAGLLGTLVALVATSAPPREPTYQYYMERTKPGPRLELTADAPARSFLVTIRADDFGPKGISTTDSGAVTLSGTIVSSGLSAAEGGFVHVRWLDPETDDAPSTITAVTDFKLVRALSFRGDCDDPSTGTCVSTLVIEAERADRGEHGGTVTVDLSQYLVSIVPKPDAPNESAVLPWSVEVVEQ